MTLDSKLRNVETWLDSVRALDHCEVTPMAMSRSKDWALNDGAIKHRSGRFFNIVGLTWTINGVQHWQPFIEQREIGTLGFIARPCPHDPNSGFELLVQAKTEPGNVDLTHLGPTCQATASNRDCVHGGSLPPYTSNFTTSEKEIVSDSLQSEQGTRFLGKKNQNIVILDKQANITDTQHRWLPFSVFRQLLLTDFKVNTDARSVLCTTDWVRLLGRLPFLGEDDFSQTLHRSFCEPIRQSAVAKVYNSLQQIRSQAPQATVCRLDAMPGWCMDHAQPTTLSDGQHAIRHIQVHAKTREVSDWDQPIFDSKNALTVDVDCARGAQGVLQFALRPCWEPGLSAVAELAPTRITRMNSQTNAIDYMAKTMGTVRLQVRQSDEGGRFYQDVASYRVVDVGEIRSDSALIWLTLAEIKALLPLGLFNNEARSALSLLLSLA